MPGNRTTNSPEMVDGTEKDFTALPTVVATIAAAEVGQHNTATEITTRGKVNNLLGTDKIPARKRNNYLLLIGIDHYENGLAKLHNPVRDANALLEVLKERYAFFPEDENAYDLLKDEEAKTGNNRYPGAAGNYKVYHDKRIKCFYNEAANKNNITDSITEMYNSIRQDMIANNALPDKAEIESQLLIYYSGHGTTVNDNYVFPATNFDENKNSSYTSIKDILFNFEKKNDCKNLLLVVDACYAGKAPVGLTSGDGDDFSRDILMSCSAAEVAVDGRRGKGSPFSVALCSYLWDNTKQSEFKASSLPESIIGKLIKLFYGDNPTQDILYGKAPANNNGSGSFKFELKDKKTPDVKLFAECLIDHLNFKKERQYFEEIDFSSLLKNNDYYLLSSVTSNDKIERLRGNIISKSFAVTLRGEGENLFQLIKFPVSVKWDMTYVNNPEDIFNLLSNRNNLAGIGINETTATAIIGYRDKVDYISAIIGRLLEPIEGDNRSHNPVCIGFIISNFSPKNHSAIIAAFIIELIKGIERYKKSPENLTKKWDKLLIYIISKMDDDARDLNSFSVESSKCVMDLFKSENMVEPHFECFNKIEDIAKPIIRNWLIKTGDSFDASGYRAFRQKQMDTETADFPKEDKLSIDKFIDKLADVIEYEAAQKEKLFNILFF